MYANFTRLQQFLIPATEDHFPKGRCTKQDRTETCIWYSDLDYLCLIVHKRFPEKREFQILSPYFWSNGHSFGLGWLTKENRSIDNIECPIHGESQEEYVIAFQEYGNPQEDYENWKVFKEKLQMFQT